MAVFFIAEAGVNHNGDGDRALAMVDAAHAAGADAIKFQTFTAEKLVSPLAQKADYQKRETGDGNQHDMLKRLEMSEDLHRALVGRCAALGIEFMSTPFDEEAATFLLGLGMKHIKVPSGEITNHPYLKFLAKHDAPMILSTGMANLEEIIDAVAIIRATREVAGFSVPLEQRLTILHCTSNYPAACSDVNLRAMATIAKATAMPVGYSDHTLGLAVSTAAVALGATVIEKHFTLDRGLAGPDHSASLEVPEMAALIKQIRDVEAALGSAIKAPTESELPVRAVARRSICARRDIAVGDVLALDDLILLRPASGIAPKHWDEIPSRVAAKSIVAGTPITWDDLA